MKFTLIDLKRLDTKYYEPVPLTPDKNIERALEYMEDNIGQSWDKTKESFPFNILHNLQYSQALKNLLFSRFYRASPPDIAIPTNEIFDFDTGKKSGISPKKLIHESNYVEQRLELFRLVNKRFGGKIDRKQSPEVLKKCLWDFQKRSDDTPTLPPEYHNNLLQYLFRDHQDLLVVSSQASGEKGKSEHPLKIEEICGVFNAHILKRLIKEAKEMQFFIRGNITGRLYRKVQYGISRSGFFANFIQYTTKGKKTEPCLLIDIFQPQSTVIHPIKTKRRFKGLFYFIWNLFSGKMEKMPELIVPYRGNDVRVTTRSILSNGKDNKQKEKYKHKDKKKENEKNKERIERANISDVKNENKTHHTIHRPQEFGLSFDSDIERIIFRKLQKTNILGQIKRDSEIITVDHRKDKKRLKKTGDTYKSTIIIPDLQITYRENSLYLEIAGFWTQNYQEKKMEKLQALSKTSFPTENFVLFVDKRVHQAHEFKRLPYPVFYYNADRLNISDLNEYIIGWQKKRAKEWKQRITPILYGKIKRKLKKDDVITPTVVKRMMGAKTVEEADQTLQNIWKTQDLNEIALLLHDTTILSRKRLTQYLGHIDEVFQEAGADEMEKKQLTARIQEDIPKQWLSEILEVGGYQIKYKNLTTQIVLRVKEQK